MSEVKVVKVSVIIPVYNTAEYLEECLDSVVKQTLSEIEIICIDDGSTDYSADILNKYACRHKNIKVIHRENGGYGSAVNEGIRNATGRYVGIVDSDDFVDFEMYKRLYEEAVKDGADIVKSDFFEIRSRSFGHGYKKKLITLDYKLETTSDKGNIISENSVFNFAGMNIWTGIYKLDFLKKNNIWFNESPGAAFQDNGFWFQTICYAKNIVFLKNAFYNYRKDNPKSSIHDKKKVFDICNEYDFIKNFLKSNKRFYDRHFIDYITQKYYAYIDAYRRISEKNKLKFLKKIAEEFEDDLRLLSEIEHGIDDIQPYALGEILRICDSPEIYYYESTIDRYTKLKKKINNDMEMLKVSKEYAIGEKLAGLKNKLNYFFKFSKRQSLGVFRK